MTDYFHNLSQNIRENSKDYYFLIVNKENPSDVFATTLKSLSNLVPSGNNLPFQTKWDDNRTLIQRDFELAKTFILGTFEKSLQLRADAHFLFKKYFNEES